ncbi:N-formylglutamate amidohydrolase (HutG) [Commensalibacter communis]|uniref:N-formylglutamate amidohydrolase n=1 Tax=Commensalibacter communis TaxID=2972786 RepID=UPI0022FF74A2|nr:N-formylglutamate amidohydrolase [Commensalibacter communis]CAI3941520.1 N-formylglutamate amidohydrolase (HutG) [Commensalibacter communis]
MSLFDLINPPFSEPFLIQRPHTTPSYPILISSPHSGMEYDSHLLSLCRLSLDELRKSEDSYVNLLLEHVSQYGVTFLQTCLPRIFCDLNREAWELDPDLFKEPLPEWCHTNSPQVKRGLGTVHKISNNGKQIYKYYLSFPKIKQRIETYWFSYHQQIQGFIQKNCEGNGGCIILDIHSMPSMPKRNPYYADIVLGDGFSLTCSPTLINNSQKFFTDKGLKVSKNIPYAGGYITRHYGNPHQNVHVMQIEINKSLYMDEDSFELHNGFSKLQSILDEYVQWVCAEQSTILKLEIK